MNTAEKIEARYAILASLPLPSGIPEDSLTPILIPAPYTLHDFVGTTSGVSTYSRARHSSSSLVLLSATAFSVCILLHASEELMRI